MTGAADRMARLYAAFNARDINAVFQEFDPQVAWANGMDGGHVHGLAAVRDYWTRQWTMIDPNVQPISVRDDGEAIIVEVRQTVRDLSGQLLSEGNVRHIYRLKDGRVIRMDIEKDG